MSKCKEWNGSFWNHGYGYASGHKLAHRVAYEKAHGKIPDGMLVCHHCDNKKCVNVEHLFLGTYADNNRDCEKKGRRPHLGVTQTPEQKQRCKKMGLSNTGRKHSEISRKNMGLSRLGKKRGKYTIHKQWTISERMAFGQKIREARLGTKLINGHWAKSED
jgi:hypothetical protein